MTVEPEGRSEPGSLEPAEGSFFAIVDKGSAATGGLVMYTVRNPLQVKGEPELLVGAAEQGRVRQDDLD